MAEDFARLRGRKVGLITNHTATTADGRNIVDIFLAAEGFKLQALFSPEHGFTGSLDQSEIADSKHSSGLKIHSLYGKTRRPSDAMLEGLDTLVFDIQDIGCRFYTYVSTMGEAMQAAAAHDIRFLVLDRPNPLGGQAVAGPVRDLDKRSFTAFARIPIRHGMTIGELALWIRDEQELSMELEIVQIQRWQREQWFEATSLYWTNPSPNMRSLTQAALYPGIGLLEFTNVSVGRGTDAPFEWIGAPWIDGQALAHRVHSDEQLRGTIACVPVRFTPTASKFKGERCRGVRFMVLDRQAFDPLRLGMVLACGLRDLHPEQWQPARYRKLLAHDATFERLRAGATSQALIAGWSTDLSEFKSRRQKFLLY